LIIFLLFRKYNYNIYYGTAKNPQNKKAKKGERAGQRQKQKQTQRIIINLGEELAKRGGGGDGALIHSLPPNTRRGLCMTRATNDAGGVKP
jgi:hypothetical protein